MGVDAASPESTWALNGSKVAAKLMCRSGECGRPGQSGGWAGGGVDGVAGWLGPGCDAGAGFSRGGFLFVFLRQVGMR